jgi:hypothetical protein
MSRNAITDNYLDYVDRHGVGADELPALVGRTLDLVTTSYQGRCLSRPAFLDEREWTLLEQDMINLRTALTDLPNLLFGGEIGAFARAAGMNAAQASAVQRAQTATPSQFTRGDIFHDGVTFKLMELNMGSTVGGPDVAVVNQALLAHPAFAAFAEANHLSYVDTMAHFADAVLTECQIPDGQRPVMAAADWPTSFESLEPILRASAITLADYGIDMLPCHLGQLEVRDGRVWLAGRAVDVLFRLFLIEDLLDPEGPRLIEPLLRAAERGEVILFTPLDAELYGSKTALAMLSDEANRHLFTAATLDSLDRLLPWTRVVRDGPVTVAGTHVDLVEYARCQRENLVLKPAMMHGGLGVVLGWQVDADEWHNHLSAAMADPYVLQQRIPAPPEMFPTGGGAQPYLLNWGVFSTRNGYGGAFVRGSTDLGGRIMNVASGATLGCCFHEGSSTALGQTDATHHPATSAAPEDHGLGSS